MTEGAPVVVSESASPDTLPVAVVGTCDIDSAADLLTPWVIAAELNRRLGGTATQVLAPLGELRPLPRDAGRWAAPFPGATGRSEAFRSAYSCVVVCGPHSGIPDDGALAGLYDDAASAARAARPTEVLLDGADPDGTCPTVWHGVGVPALAPDTAGRVRTALAGRLATVSDTASRRHLGGAGVEVEVVPDPVVAAGRLFDAGALERRRRFLRAAGWIPDGNGALVVQGDAATVSSAPALAAALADAGFGSRGPVVLVSAGRPSDDGPFLDALSAALAGDRVHRMPADAGLDDLVAAVGSAQALICRDRFLAGAALGQGVPLAILTDVGGDDPTAGAVPASVPRADPADAGRLLADVAGGRLPRLDPVPILSAFDASMDALATAVGSLLRPAQASGSATEEGASPAALVVALREANRQLLTRLADERTLMQAELARVDAERRADLRRAADDIQNVLRQLAEARGEVDHYARSRTWRYTEPLRALARRAGRGTR